MHHHLTEIHYSKDIKSQLGLLDLGKVEQVFPDLYQRVKELGRLQRQYIYREPHWAVAALLHRSSLVFWPKDRAGIFSNEKLEFLGDSLLNAFVSKLLMAQTTSWQEGELSRARAKLVGAPFLAEKAKSTGLSSLILLGKGERLSSDDQRINIYADLFEAALAALWLDGGEDPVHQWLSQIYDTQIFSEKMELSHYDPKSRMQQWTQKWFNVTPQYLIIPLESPSEGVVPLFQVSCQVFGMELGLGQGQSKKEASRLAAEAALSQVLSHEIELKITLQKLSEKGTK